MEDLQNSSAIDLNKLDNDTDTNDVDDTASKEIEMHKSSKRPTTLNFQLNHLQPQPDDIKGNDVPSSSTNLPFDADTRNIKRLDIGFSNITYTVKTGFFKKENKTILKGISGEFKSGELTAIMGPSGAGKSTMLNVLSGYTIFNIEGEITINGNVRDLKAFIPQSAYITQDTDLHPTLTVSEAMHFSASLKIGKNMTKSERRDRVKTILEAIALYNTRHTRTGNLSGGQKKRLAIALELVNNPPVLILDEPTSGLDSSTSNQCITLLKKLAKDGRTIICTIHQPAAIAFRMFDHVYTLADGECIYSGKAESVVPFLSEMYLNCPESYNPADYLLELATNDYGYQNFRLVEKIQNGKNDSYRRNRETTAQVDAMKKVERMMEAGLLTPVEAPHMHNTPLLVTPKLAPVKEVTSTLETRSNDSIPQSTTNTPTKPKKPTIEFDAGKLCNSITIYATPFHEQLVLLLYRTFLILWRDRSLSNLRIMIHIIMATFVGVLYLGIGNDASNTLNNFRYIFYTIMFVMYTAFSSMLVNFPLEFPIVSREHFNRWYSLRAYYVALTLADLPIQILCTALFILISYPMTGQPFELLRISLFSTMVFLTAIVAQSIGLAVGSALSVKYGAIFGPFFICPFLTFSGFFLQLNDAPKYLHWLFHISFLKYGLEGSVLAIFGYDRPKMLCDKVYCHYTRPKVFIKDIGMSNANYQLALFALIVTCLMLKTLAFYIMSFRLRLFR